MLDSDFPCLFLVCILISFTGAGTTRFIVEKAKEAVQSYKYSDGMYDSISTHVDYLHY